MNDIAEVIGGIPYRLALCGGWIDQPFVSALNPSPPRQRTDDPLAVHPARRAPAPLESAKFSACRRSSKPNAPAQIDATPHSRAQVFAL